MIVRCRPSKEFWQVVGLIGFEAVGFGFLGFLSTLNPRPAPRSAISFIECLVGALILLITLLCVWGKRAEIGADAAGLHWRRMGRWKRADWADIHDYYEVDTAQRRLAYGKMAAKKASLIKTAAGNLSVTNYWTNYDALRALVEQKATNARISEWGVLGSRPVDDWPRVFHYDTFDNRWSPRIILKISLLLLPYVMINPLLKIYTTLGVLGWLVALTTGVLYLLLCLACAYIPIALLAQYQVAARRKGQRLTADMSGLRFEDHARVVGASWEEVSDFYLDAGSLLSPVRSVVVTKNGEFDFLDKIKDGRLLQIIISRYTVNVSQREWRARKDIEDLGGMAAKWSGGQEGVGARLYHYRTRTNRAMMLWLPAALTLMFALLLLVYAGLGMAQGASRFGLVIPSAVSALVFCAAWAAYRAATIHIDEEGITQYGPFLRRFIAWDKVQDFYINSMDKGIVVGRDARVSIGSMIVDREELEAEIARRATESRRRTWELPARSGSPRTGG